MPEPPGPPGFVSSTPTRRPWAGRRARPSWILRPFGMRPVERHRQRRALDRAALVPDQRAGSVRSQVLVEHEAGPAPADRRRTQCARRSTAFPWSPDPPPHTTGRGGSAPFGIVRFAVRWRLVFRLSSRGSGLPRRDALRSRQLARRRRRGTTAARRDAGATRAAAVRRRLGPRRRRRDRGARSARRARRCRVVSLFEADETRLRLRRRDAPELSIACIPSAAASTSAACCSERSLSTARSEATGR